MGDKVRLVVDKGVCMSTGACAFAAPDSIELDADGYPQAPPDLDADDQAVQDAVADCPTGALTLEPAE